MIMPSTITLLRTVFLDDRERAIAVGVWTAIAAGGFAVGPVIGGALLEVLDWPWVFALQVPVVLLAIVAVLRLVPEWRSADPGPWDPIGVALSITGMVALVWGIKEASKHGFGDAAALGTLALGAGSLTAFVRRQRKLTHPLLDIALFRDRRFAASAVAVLAVFFGFGGLLLLLTQFFQIVQGHGPLEAGLRLLPLALAAGIASPLTDAAVRRVGAHVVVGGGFAIVARRLRRALRPRRRHPLRASSPPASPRSARARAWRQPPPRRSSCPARRPSARRAPSPCRKPPTSSAARSASPSSARS